jgi:hypothetical protein
VKRCGRWPALPLLALLLGVSTSTAAASVTVGQIATPTNTCASPVDRVQPAVSSGNSYVISANGTITSWSTNTGTNGGEIKMKVFRPVSGTPNTFMVVAQDGPRTLALNTINMFPVSIQVKAGDLLGMNSFSGTPDCGTLVTGDSYLREPPAGGTGDLGIGQSAAFTGTVNDRRLDISAQLDPTNTLTFGQVVRNKKKGTATLPVDVPNAGQLDFAAPLGKVVETAAVKTVTAPGTLRFKIKAKGRKRTKLNETGKVKVTPRFTFTPTGGTSNTQGIKIKLRKQI